MQQEYSSTRCRGGFWSAIAAIFQARVAAFSLVHICHSFFGSHKNSQSWVDVRETSNIDICQRNIFNAYINADFIGGVSNFMVIILGFESVLGFMVQPEPDTSQYIQSVDSSTSHFGYIRYLWRFNGFGPIVQMTLRNYQCTRTTLSQSDGRRLGLSTPASLPHHTGFSFARNEI